MAHREQAPSTLGNVLNAVTWQHLTARMADPTDDILVRRFLKAHRGRHRDRVVERPRPLTDDKMTLISEAPPVRRQRGGALILWRDRASILISAQSGAPARQLGRVARSAVRLADDGSLEVDLPEAKTVGDVRCPARTIRLALDEPAHEALTLLLSELDPLSLAEDPVFNVVSDAEPGTERACTGVGRSTCIRMAWKAAFRRAGLTFSDPVALTDGPLNSLWDHCLPSHDLDLRDTALTAVAQAIGSRPGEPCILLCEDLIKHPEGWDWVLRDHKTMGMVGTPRYVHLRHDHDRPICPVCALDEWLEVLGPSGPVFPAMHLGGLRRAWPVESESVTNAIARTAARAGLEGISGRSARSGRVTSDAVAGKTLAQITAPTGHRTQRVVQISYANPEPDQRLVHDL